MSNPEDNKPKDMAAAERGSKGGKAKVPKGFGHMDPLMKEIIQSMGGSASARAAKARKGIRGK